MGGLEGKKFESRMLCVSLLRIPFHVDMASGYLNNPIISSRKPAIRALGKHDADRVGRLRNTVPVRCGLCVHGDGVPADVYGASDDWCTGYSGVRWLFGCGLVGLLVVLIVPLFLSFLAMPGLCCFLRVTRRGRRQASCSHAYKA